MKNIKHTYTLIGICLSAVVLAVTLINNNLPSKPGAGSPEIKNSQAQKNYVPTFNWDDYDTLLKQYVYLEIKSGIQTHVIDYHALGDTPEFMSINAALTDFEPVFNTRNEKLSFYINAYNYYAIKLIVDNNESESIKNIGSILNPVWKYKAGVIGGEKITLDFIEHKILRAMNEPRIHFAIVCASLSCPDIRQEAYSANTLDAQLDDQSIKFLKNPTKGIKVSSGKVEISRLFKWFSEDFGNIRHYIQQYHSVNTKDEIGYLPYSWELNSKTGHSAK